MECIQPLNLGLNLAWKYTQDREQWKDLVETATIHGSSSGLARKDDESINQCRIRMQAQYNSASISASDYATTIYSTQLIGLCSTVSNILWPISGSDEFCCI